MDRVGARHRVAHGEPIEQVRNRFTKRIGGADSDDSRERREPLRAVVEDKVVRRAGCVRQDLSNRGVRVRAGGNEPADRVVEREASFFDAAQDERRREYLRQPVDMEWGVGPRGNRPLEVLPAERTLPQDGVASDDDGGKTGNPGLRPEGFHVIPEPAEDQLVTRIVGVDRHAGEQRDGDRKCQSSLTHGTTATSGSCPQS